MTSPMVFSVLPVMASCFMYGRGQSYGFGFFSSILSARDAFPEVMQTMRFLLFPVALAYGLAVWLRNKMYDTGILKSESFHLPVISVGNLTTGGTGKTPHIEYLIR